MKEVYELIKTCSVTRYIELMNYYRGKSPITLRKMDDGKPNNKIVSSFAINAVDTIQGYFMGKPVSYSGDEAQLEKLHPIFDDNDEQEINSEHAKQVAIKGKSYELVFVNEDAELKFAQVNAENVIVEYDDSIIPKMKRATIFYPEYKDGKMCACDYSVYLPQQRLDYHQEGDKDPVQVDDVALPFTEIPLIEFTANSECMGLFEKAITAIDAYEKTVSDTANDMEYFTDAYLWLPGFGGFDPDNEEDMKKLRGMRNNKVFLPNDEEHTPPQFIVKQINDTATENHKDRLKNEIHRMLNIPDLTDENFAGTQSGVSLKYKLWGLENICSTFERRFKRSLQKRLRLINQFLDVKGSSYDYKDIQISFSRNLPDNTVETAELAEKVRGLVSDETLLGWIDRVEDPKAEMERRELELESKVDLDEYVDDVEPIEEVEEGER